MCHVQILSMTCDNASNNNAMIHELSSKVPEFGGAATHTRCFLHTVNLVAKLLIREFNVKKQDVDLELQDLSANIEEDAEIGCEEDNDEGLIDEVELLDAEERVTLEKDIQPVKLALAKVSSIKLIKLTIDPNPYPSCESSHTKSSTRPPSSFQHGTASSKTWRSCKHSCHEMWRLDGIQPLICIRREGSL